MFSAWPYDICTACNTLASDCMSVTHYTLTIISLFVDSDCQRYALCCVYSRMATVGED